MLGVRRARASALTASLAQRAALPAPRAPRSSASAGVFVKESGGSVERTNASNRKADKVRRATAAQGSVYRHRVHARIRAHMP